MLIRWPGFDQSFAALESLRQRMDRLFDEYHGGLHEDQGLFGSPRWPRMTLHDEGQHLALYAEVPGLTDKDIRLTLERNVLTVAGERITRVPEGYRAQRQERGDYRFSQSVALPVAVDPERASATVKDGILTVRLEKAAEARPRAIEVKAS